MSVDLTLSATSLDARSDPRREEGSTGSEISGRRAALRVLHVIPNLGGGGSERFVLTLLPLLDRSVCKPQLCVLSSLNAFPMRTAGVEVVDFLGYGGSLRDLRGMRRCIRSLREIVIQNDIEIVHSHLWPAARLVAMALRGLSAEHVIQIQDTRPWLAGKGWRDRLHRLWTNIVLRKSGQTFIAVSEAVKEYTCRHLAIAEPSVSVIPNGVDLDRFRPKAAVCTGTAGRIVIGMVALMKPEKGHQHLIEAVSELAKDGLDVELRFAGDGAMRAQLEALVETAGIAERVVFVGLIDDVETFLHGLDVFVLASVFGEGLPLSILEAMACQLPVVACDVAGAGEVIRNGQNGFLVPPQSSEHLAEALRILVTNPTCRQEVAHAGLGTVQDHFGFNTVARQIESVYTDIASKQR